LDQGGPKLTKRMLPFLMKPFTLVVLTLTCILGEVMWMYRAVQDGSQLEALGLFIAGVILGFTSGRWTWQMFDKYYVQSLLKRVNIMKTPIWKQNTLFTVLALGLPMAASFIPTYQNPVLPIIQSYIFGFISGMNVAIYLWARKLPG